MDNNQPIAKYLSTQKEEKIRNATDNECMDAVLGQANGKLATVVLDSGAEMYYGSGRAGAEGEYNKRAQTFLNLMGVDDEAKGPAILFPKLAQ